MEEWSDEENEINMIDICELPSANVNDNFQTGEIAFDTLEIQVHGNEDNNKTTKRKTYALSGKWMRKSLTTILKIVNTILNP